MLSLSPAKLLVILVIAMIVLGPEKLPGVARQLGAAWGDIRRWRTRLENEVRDVFPDLPATHEVAQVVRSPLAFLDRLADEHERGANSNGASANGSDGTSSPTVLPTSAPGTPPVSGSAGLSGAGSAGIEPADDPNMN